MEPLQIDNIENEIRSANPQRSTSGRMNKPLPNNPYDILNLEGFVQTVTTVPTNKPKNFYQSIKIYTDSINSPTVRRLYIYSIALDDWLYVTLST